MKIAKLAGCLVVLAVFAAAGAVAWAWQQLHRPFDPAGADDEVTYRVEAGTPAGAVLRDLANVGVLPNAELARLWLIYRLGDPPIHAGTYRFEPGRPATRVLERLIGGDVVQLQATVIEGLTLEETATVLTDAGFGEREAFLEAMRDPAPIADLDPEAETLEGYLFPETYNFPDGTSEREIVEIMVETFRRQLEREILPLLEGAGSAPAEPGTPASPSADEVAISPGGFAAADAARLDRVAETEGAQDGTAPDGGTTPGTAESTSFDLRELVILASIVEKEAGAVDERPLVAAVYRNRLERGIGLYADPTVIYALKQRGTWDGNIRKEDLGLDSPYNTYRYRGLPPGPIASPGSASLRAAARPADVPYLYFVSRNDGTHVFAETYSEHQQNVERWQRRYWRERRAAERASGSETDGD